MHDDKVGAGDELSRGAVAAAAAAGVSSPCS